jgi:vacuolar-type H+-ATPase subunit H
MLPDLDKIMVADRKARALEAQAQKEAQELLDQAQSQVRSIQEKFQTELTQLRENVQEEILHQAEVRAAEVAAGTARYIENLREKRGTHGEEVAAFFLSQVLAQ